MPAAAASGRAGAGRRPDRPLLASGILAIMSALQSEEDFLPGAGACPSFSPRCWSSSASGSAIRSRRASRSRRRCRGGSAAQGACAGSVSRTAAGPAHRGGPARRREHLILHHHRLSITYITEAAGLTRDVALQAILIGSLVHFLTIPLAARLSDGSDAAPSTPSADSASPPSASSSFRCWAAATGSPSSGR